MAETIPVLSLRKLDVRIRAVGHKLNNPTTPTRIR